MKMSLVDPEKKQKRVKRKRRLSKNSSPKIPHIMHLSATGMKGNSRSRFNSSGTVQLMQPEESKKEPLFQGECSSVSSIEEEEPKLTERNKICVRHKLQIHSHHRVTNALICTKCVYEDNISDENLVIFPGAVRHIKERV
jgi:hypothetical protein